MLLNTNPFASKLMPWRMAQARKKMMLPIVIYLESIGDFWETWAEVYGAQR